MGKRDSPESGFSLVESLLAMMFFLLVLLCTLQSFRTARYHFNSLRETEENAMSVYAALDKLKTDASKAGSGLSLPMESEILKGVEIDEFKLKFRIGQGIILLTQDLFPGQTWLPLPKTSGLKKGQELCIHSFQSGEQLTISRVEKTGIVCNPPISAVYRKEKTEVIHLKNIIYFLDERKKILRRKVNASPAQPLCENVDIFRFSYSPETNRIKVILSLKDNQNKEHETIIFPKNMVWSRKKT